MVAYLIAYGMWLIWLGECFGTPRAALGSLCCGPTVEAARLRDALDVRIGDESPAGNSGVIAGVASIVLALTVAIGMWPQAAFAIESCLTVLVLASRYSTFRNRSGRRVALLERREIASSTPWVLVALASLASLSLATYASSNAMETAVAIGTIAIALAAIAFAIRIAKSPSRLSDRDPAAERIVDRRLRTYQAAAMLVYATTPAFVFTAFSPYENSTAQTVSRILCLIAVAGSSFWLVRSCSRKLSTVETLSLSQ